ncbi:TPA: NAD-dependent epimerase/dehydratase family protein [Enterococcus faecium]|nr:NAD-dependent epimerase/dehydratase family protein [Enterococcus faecium]
MAKRRRRSRGKKIFLIILAILVVLVLAIVGVGAKLYLDLSHSIEKTYESVERTQGERTKPVDLDKQESFSVLLMGIDTGDLGRVDQGRSDTMMVATVSPEEPFNVWGSGEQGRAFIHVNDIVNALVLALDKGWGHGHIQIGPSHCTSIKEIAYKIIEISGKDIKPFFDTSKPEGDKARCADYSKAKEILDWEPTVSLEEGLRESYNWIEKQIKG